MGKFPVSECTEGSHFCYDTFRFVLQCLNLLALDPYLMLWDENWKKKLAVMGNKLDGESLEPLVLYTTEFQQPSYNEVLMAHSKCQLCDSGIQHHMFSAYSGLWGLVAIRLLVLEHWQLKPVALMSISVTPNFHFPLFLSHNINYVCVSAVQLYFFETFKTTKSYAKTNPFLNLYQ